jgi:hypothetical protein
MIKNQDELVFYALAGIVAALAFFAFGLFGLKEQPLGIVLILASFCLNPLIVHFGKEFGEEEKIISIVAACAMAAFALIWVTDTRIVGTLAMPAAIMFVLPSAAYYFRKFAYGGVKDVSAP